MRKFLCLILSVVMLLSLTCTAFAATDPSAAKEFRLSTHVESESVTLDAAASTTLAITKQPKTAYAKSGNTVSTTVKATGDGLKYQWYVRNADESSFSKSSVTSATYSCTMRAKSKDRRVLCIVTDKYGDKVQSNTVVLRMAATITSQPKSTAAPDGTIAKAAVKATGDGLKYQWYIKNAGQSSFSKSSVTSATYSCTMNSKSDGRQAYCVITDKYGKTDKSDTITLTKMPGKNSVYIPGTGIKHTFEILPFEQSSIDNNNIVYSTYNLGSTDYQFILGHNYGTMGNLYKTKVGQYIYVSVNGKVETYKVVVSEYGLQNSSKTTITGQTTGTDLWRNYDVKSIRLYTCYGSNKNGRWMVLATKV